MAATGWSMHTNSFVTSTKSFVANGNCQSTFTPTPKVLSKVEEVTNPCDEVTIPKHHPNPKNDCRGGGDGEGLSLGDVKRHHEPWLNLGVCRSAMELIARAVRGSGGLQSFVACVSASEVVQTPAQAGIDCGGGGSLGARATCNYLSCKHQKSL